MTSALSHAPCERWEETRLSSLSHSSDLTSLRGKIAELFRYKDEALSLRAQLQRANERLRTQAAEVSSAPSGIRSEIPIRKSADDSTPRLTPATEPATAPEEAAVRKRSARTGRCELCELTQETAEIENLKADNRRLHREMLELRAGLNEQRKESQQRLEVQAERHSRIISEKDVVIAEKSQKIERLVEANERMKGKLGQLRQMLKGRSGSLLEKVESSVTVLQNISQLLRIETGQWDQITEKVRSLVDLSDQIRALRNENEKLGKQLAIVLQPQHREKKGPRQHSPVNETVGNLKESLARRENDVSALTRRIRFLSLRCNFARVIAAGASSLTKIVDNLHQSLFNGTQSRLRPIVLSLVFAQRMTLPRKQYFVCDQCSLLIYLKQPETSTAGQLNEIRGEITRLTKDLVAAKQSLLDSEKQRLGLISRIAELEAQLNDDNRLQTVARHQLTALKSRNLELQRELATLISPEDYTACLERARDLEVRTKHLATERTELKADGEKRTRIERQLREKIDRLEVKERVWRDEEARVHGSFDEKDTQIADLRRILRENIGDVVSLERALVEQRDAAAAAHASMTVLATENKLRAGSGR
jgi:chromosome segregation ATPase